jgi:5S rRNA maturation endonuclease (ribonuclease M5)
MSDEFELICSELERKTGFTPKGSPKRRKGKCPAHDDENASLSVRDDLDKGVIGVTCFAGCGFEEIVKALDLTTSDFRTSSGARPAKPREEPQGKPEGSEVARYVYTDEEGKPLYYNIRYQPKTFRMAGPDGVVRGLPKNLRRVPYRLPEVLRAVRDEKTIYWVEGEKDADRLAELGLVATTTAGGANSPLDREWADLFKGATVISVADKDKSGREYARAVGRLLVNTARSWTCTESATPQAKSDVSDHLAAGYELDRLVAVPMRSVRRTRWTIGALLETKPEPLNWVFPGVIPEGLTLLVGAPKAGKSWFNLNLLVSLATGRPDEVFGWGKPHDPSPSLYLALEDPHRRVHDRLIKVVSGTPFDEAVAGDIWLDLPDLKAGGRDEIERWLEANPTSRCIMVDVLAKVRGQQDTSSGLYQADYEAVGALKEIADEFGIGVVVTHHDRKKTSDDFVDMVSGTKGVTGAADTILYLQRERGSTTGILKCESRDVEECTYRIEFDKDSGRWGISDRLEAGQDPNEPQVDLLTQVRQMLMARGESEFDDLARILDVDQRSLRRTVQAAKQQGNLAQTRAGLWCIPESGKEEL